MNKLCLALLAGSIALSAIAEEATETPLLEGNAEQGAAKAATCVACHGQDGNSLNGEWPKLAGQHAPYIVRQLTLYKSGGRQNPIMQGMAAALSVEDMQDLAAHFQSQTIKPGVADVEHVVVGEQLFRGGSPERGIPACAACHGPSGRGNPLAGYPSLAGQHALYTAVTLRAFRDGMVWGKDDRANAIMANVVERLNDAEIEALASYIEGLH